MAITRDDLFRSVWAAPMLEVAREHGVSANYLARVCRHLNVPHPPRGYWAKLAAGHVVNAPALPAARPGEVLAWERGDNVPHPRAQKPKPSSEPASRSKPRDEHELVDGVLAHFEKARLSEHGYLRPYKRNLVDVFVTKDLLDGALAAANDLFKELETRGHRVALAPGGAHRPELALYEGQTFEYYRREPWRPDRPTLLFIGDVAIGLTIYETTEHVEVTYEWDGPIRYVRANAARKRRSNSFRTTPHKEHMPSGLLGLRAYAPYHDVAWERRWAEGAPGKFRDLIGAISKGLASAVPEIKRLRADAHERAAERRRQWEEADPKHRAEERRRRRAEAVVKSREELFAIIAAWAEARDVEAFFADVLDRTTGEPAKREVLQRIDLARDLLGSTDALTRLRLWRAPAERIPDGGAEAD